MKTYFISNFWFRYSPLSVTSFTQCFNHLWYSRNLFIEDNPLAPKQQPVYEAVVWEVYQTKKYLDYIGRDAGIQSSILSVLLILLYDLL